MEYYEEIESSFETRGKCVRFLQQNGKRVKSGDTLTNLWDKIAKVKNIWLPNDERHWLQHLRGNLSPSQFLSDHHVSMNKLLDDRRELLARHNRRKFASKEVGYD